MSVGGESLAGDSTRVQDSTKKYSLYLDLFFHRISSNQHCLKRDDSYPRSRAHVRRNERMGMSDAQKMRRVEREISLWMLEVDLLFERERQRWSERAHISILNLYKIIITICKSSFFTSSLLFWMNGHQLYVRFSHPKKIIHTPALARSIYYTRVVGSNLE